MELIKILYDIQQISPLIIFIGIIVYIISYCDFDIRIIKKRKKRKKSNLDL